MDDIFWKKFIDILKFFKVEYDEIKDFLERLRRLGYISDILAVFQDLFKFQRVMELYCR